MSAKFAHQVLHCGNLGWRALGVGQWLWKSRAALGEEEKEEACRGKVAAAK